MKNLDTLHKALSESSLIETLKVYEQLQASRSIENEFETHEEPQPGKDSNIQKKCLTQKFLA